MPPLASFSAAIYAGIAPPPRAFVDGASLIPCRNITLLSGDGSTGKSLLALQLAVAIAAETTWLGIAVACGPVVYMSAEEDRTEIHNRLYEISVADDIDLANAANLEIVYMVGQDATLANEAPGGKLKTTRLFEQLDAKLREIEPVLLILDNLADIFSGNENNRSLVKHFVGLLRGLAIDHDCAILLLGHPSLSGMSSGTGMSGSTAWSNSVRSRLYLRRVIAGDGSEADETQRILEVKKINYGPKGQPYGLRWRDGRFVRADPPKPFDDVSVADLERVQQAFATHDYRASEQSPDWGGYAVADILDLDVGRNIGRAERAAEQNRARAKVRTILATWLRNKAISIVKRRTDQREMKEFYEAGRSEGGDDDALPN
ncbi:AAA family ATPase [Mesorhizobium kowhaii]|uniref:AAA family ATPase n=1 Tax=Mesorhizobium kowhaii TaxID=1300272 RepID=UPI00142DA809|nr:AAA family ATPase [Mesorhizobium kowhaii]